MNYKTRFNKIVEKIGERREIEGIARIYIGTDGYFSIKAEEFEITRGCSGGVCGVRFAEETHWDVLKDFSQKIEDWFSYVEEKVAS